MTSAKGFISSGIPDKFLVITSLVLFKLSWLLLVLMHNRVLIPVAFIQIIAVAINPHFSRKFPVVLALTATGFLLEQGAAAGGVISIPSTDSLLWLMLLWFSFVLALTHGLGFLGKLSLRWQFLVGALAGPLAYEAASGLGALTFVRAEPVSLLILSAGWALFLPIALHLLHKSSQPAIARLRQLAVLVVLLLTTRADAGNLIGQGSLRFLFMPVYDASLIGESADFVYPPQRPFTLKLLYHRPFSAQAIVNETLRQWEAQGVTVHPGWQEVLATIIVDVDEGDELALSVDEDLVARLLFNDKPIGEIHDPQLLEAFVGIWLAPNTTKPQLRNQLLGLE